MHICIDPCQLIVTEFLCKIFHPQLGNWTYWSQGLPLDWRLDLLFAGAFLASLVKWASCGNDPSPSTGLVRTSRLYLGVPRGPLCNVSLPRITPLKSQSRGHPAPFLQSAPFENRKPGCRKIFQHNSQRWKVSAVQLLSRATSGVWFRETLLWLFCFAQFKRPQDHKCQPNHRHHRTSEAQEGLLQFFFLWKRWNN